MKSEELYSFIIKIVNENNTSKKIKFPTGIIDFEFRPVIFKVKNAICLNFANETLKIGYKTEPANVKKSIIKFMRNWTWLKND